MKFVIGALLGAIIGYITNWLAIKMLFRPHYEKRIFGIKVPFTPGLIPKEKSRIAKSVGEAIGDHLLTKETMVNSLCSDTINNGLKNWVTRKVTEFQNEECTLGDKVKSIAAENYMSIKKSVEKKISGLAIKALREEKSKDYIKNIISTKINELLQYSPEVILNSKIYIKLKEELLNKVVILKDSEEFNMKLNEIIKGKVLSFKGEENTFEDVIPESLINEVKTLIYNKRSEIAKEIKELLKDPKAQSKIKDTISNVLSTKLSPMIAMFISKDSVYEKIMPVVNEMLDKDENQEEIVSAINKIIDKMLQHKVGEALSNISEDSIDENLDSIIKVLINKFIDNSLIENIMDIIERHIGSEDNIEAILNKVDEDSANNITSLVVNYIYSFIQTESFEMEVNKVVSSIVEKLMNTEIRVLLREENHSLSTIISNLAEDLYNKFIKNKASDVVEALNIPQIVEDKINEFDVAFAEDIILDLASKELRAITWLGALLGSIIGLISPILGSL